MPCRLLTTLHLQLLYPDFRIRLPGFLRPEHKATFLRLIERRDKVRSAHLYKFKVN
jgi:hypothetical protein